MKYERKARQAEMWSENKDGATKEKIGWNEQWR